MNETIKLAIKLFVITAVVAALLAVVNMVTEPLIEANNEKTFNETMAQVLPEAEEFEEVDVEITPEDGAVTVDSVYAGRSDGKVVGYVVAAVCSEGYGGDITVMTGINSDFTVNKAEVTEMDETPGLGAKAQGEWIDQFQGLSEDIEVDKNGSAQTDNKVEAISGATITSRAVTKAVNESIKAAEESASLAADSSADTNNNSEEDE